MALKAPVIYKVLQNQTWATCMCMGQGGGGGGGSVAL